MNVLGRNFHLQGLDECQESCINKDVKAALNTRKKTALTANILRNLKECFGIAVPLAISHEENVLILKSTLEIFYLFAIYFDQEVKWKNETDKVHHLFSVKSKTINNDQEPIQSDPTSCPQNQKGNN